MTTQLQGNAAPRRSISDTILDFAQPVLAEIHQPASLEVIRHTLEMVINVWNAHVMAMPVWGHPEHLAGLLQLAGPDAKPHLVHTLATLGARRQLHFADDARVVSKWDLVLDELGRTRFDCTARLPAVTAN